MQFLKLIEQAKATGQKQPLTWAIREAVRHNILKDYLERHGGEVLSILMTEYDYATDIAVKQEEAYAIGMERGRLEGLERGAYETKLETARSFIAMGLSLEQVALGTGLPIETVMELAQTK